MENLNKAIIAEITGLAIDIQNAGIGEVMYRVNGHLGNMDVDVYLGGWHKGKDADMNLYISLTGKTCYIQPAEAIAKLTALLNPVTA